MHVFLDSIFPRGEKTQSTLASLFWNNRSILSLHVENSPFLWNYSKSRRPSIVAKSRVLINCEILIERPKYLFCAWMDFPRVVSSSRRFKGTFKGTANGPVSNSNLEFSCSESNSADSNSIYFNGCGMKSFFKRCTNTDDTEFFHVCFSSVRNWSWKKFKESRWEGLILDVKWDATVKEKLYWTAFATVSISYVGPLNNSQNSQTED